MNSNIDNVRDILSCAIEDNLYRVEALFAAKDQRIADLTNQIYWLNIRNDELQKQLEIRVEALNAANRHIAIVEAALARATAGVAL